MRVASSAPTKVYGIRNKGDLAPGYDGDVVVVDPNERGPLATEWLHSKVGYSPFAGWTLAGWPRGLARKSYQPTNSPLQEPSNPTPLPYVMNAQGRRRRCRRPKCLRCAQTLVHCR